MKLVRPSGVSFVLALLMAMMTAPSVSAFSSIGDPPVPATALLNLIPDGSINFVGTVVTPTGEVPTNVQVGIGFGGNIFYSDILSPAEGTSLPFSIPAPTNALIANCVAGVLSYTYWNVYGGESVALTAECSVLVDVPPPPVVTPILPTVQTEVCGPANDVITIPEQPAGIITNDPGWAGNTRTIYFTVEPGYVIAGTASAEFVDAAVPCPTEVPLTPAVTVTPFPDPTDDPSASPTVVPTDVPSVVPTDAPPVVPPVVPPVQPTVAPPAPAAPSGVVTSLPNTGSGSSDMALAVAFGVIAVLATAGVAGVYRFTRR